jgi:hypothetical protein
VNNTSQMELVPLQWSGQYLFINDSTKQFDTGPGQYGSGVYARSGAGNSGCSPACNSMVWGAQVYDSPCPLCEAQFASLFHQVEACACDETLSNTTLGDYEFPEGIYCFSNPLTVTGTITTVGGVGNPQTVIRAPQLTIAPNASIYYTNGTNTPFAKLLFYSNSTIDLTWTNAMRFNATFLANGNFVMNWQVDVATADNLYDNVYGVANGNFSIYIPSTLTYWSLPPDVAVNLC